MSVETQAYTMTFEGALIRLSKAHFTTLMKEPLTHWAKGSRNNNYPLWSADPSRPAVLRKGLHRPAMRPFPRLAGRAPRRPKISSYYCASPK